eukprot:CAMPEP_0116565360 /NCGR_PEP_ID=MMETSP0397-20121206/13856_1 /TAXON_ID=216820 /ORGANISM="Cyclophora tenuis, Strain ECT3854" /LENGTH=260 /DNA_ID=CAMNT_0004092127 /DNA_START=127 /DNA_END=909 /DNA_ORIENTATION=+
MYYVMLQREFSSKTPIVTIHGGPGLPSDYLLPLQDVVVDRDILFYDQLGCGRSDAPRDISNYSIDQSIDDLVALLEAMTEELGGDFHLYGHSFGGVIAYEYLKRERPTNCRSVVLSSSPANVAQSNADWDRLQEAISAETFIPFLAEEKFRQQHLCRTFLAPKALGDAFVRAGRVWSGTEMESIKNYRATIRRPLIDPPALLLRGEHDFVVRSNLDRWNSVFAETETVELTGCSHHGLLEQPKLYGTTLESFWTDIEGPE